MRYLLFSREIFSNCYFSKYLHKKDKFFSPRAPKAFASAQNSQNGMQKLRRIRFSAQKNTRKSLRALCRKNTRNSLRASRRKNTRGRGGRKMFAHPFLLWYNTCIRKKYLPPRACKAERKYHVQNIADRLFGHRRPVCRRVCVRFHICQFCRRHTLRCRAEDAGRPSEHRRLYTRA